MLNFFLQLTLVDSGVEAEVYEYLIPIRNLLDLLFCGNIGTAFSALSGTFLGAYLVFFFQRRYTDKKERVSKISASKHAQFAIITQLSAVKNIKKQVLDPQRDDPLRHLNLKPFSVLVQFPSLDIDSLVFMLEDEGAQLLNELMTSEQKFRTLLGVLNLRSQRHELLQQQHAKFGDEAFDDATMKILKDMTDSIFALCDDALSGLQDSFEKLSAYIRKRFPGVKALSVEFKY